MIQCQLKLKLTVKQEKRLDDWLFVLTGVWNWAIRKIELDAKDKIYHSKFGLEKFIYGHGKKVGVSQMVIKGVIFNAHRSWERCFTNVSRQPRLKGKRNPLNSILFPDKLLPPNNDRITLSIIGALKFHKQDIPEGKINCVRLVKRPSGWYACLFIDAKPNKIPIISNEIVGIDPGFSTSLTLSNGEKIDQPKEFNIASNRLAQAQRGKRKHLASRIQERIRNSRRDNNHKLSRVLVGRFAEIYFSKDRISVLQRKFGRSVMDAGHHQLRRMVSYKSSSCRRKYVEVDSKYSTMTCSNCGCKSGPSGLSGLKVRFWECQSCGRTHDRDVNAAMNTLKTGLGMSLGVLKPHKAVSMRLRGRKTN
jgi:transposase